MAYLLKKEIGVFNTYCLIGAMIFLISCTNSSPFKSSIKDQDWPYYGGNMGGNRYSDLSQINSTNVRELQVAWIYNAVDTSKEAYKPREIQCQPIVINGILYGTSPELELFALQAGTGKELWKFNPFENREPRLHSNRGVMYWEDGEDKRILYSAGNFLYAVNAITGIPVKEFGENGAVSLSIGIGENLGRDTKDLSVIATSPGIIYKDLVIMGSTVSESGNAAPGDIRAYDIKNGALRWVFHTIPQPGEFGYETWPEEAWKFMGGANNWAGMVLDDKRGMVFMGTGSPSADFYGGARAGKNLFGNCILALNAATGKLVWHFQTVHHDLWDRDIACQPNLVTVKHGGKLIDAVAQSTKDGLVFLLDRDSGLPLFPVEERPALTDYALPGEQPYPTQPFPTKPVPFARQVFTEEDITDLSPEAHAFVKKRWLEARSGSKFMPLSKEGTLYFGIGGGANWGGNASDPEGILYQNSNEMVWDVKVAEGNSPLDGNLSAGKLLYMNNCSNCHDLDGKSEGKEFPDLGNVGERLTAQEITHIIVNGQGRMPSFQYIAEKDRVEIVKFLLNIEDGQSLSANIHRQKSDSVKIDKIRFPYVPPFINNGLHKFLDPEGYPAVKPPWGTLNAIDLNTGEYLWKVPLGEFPELSEKGLPITGTENYGGPIVTAGGLVFIAGTKDEKIRAFDKNTGEVLWAYQLPAGGFATPISYQLNGKQFVVIAAGGVKNGHKPGGAYIAFSLPENTD